MTSPDPDPIAAFLRGEAEGLERLLDAHGEDAYGLALGMLKDPLRAADVMALAIARLRERPQARPEGMAAGHFLSLLVRHAGVNALRAADQGRRPSDAPMRLPDLPLAPPDPFPFDSAYLTEALAGLDPVRSEALRRIWCKGEDYPAIARYFQIPLAQVRPWLDGGLRQLADRAWRPLLGEDDELMLLTAGHALGLLTETEAAALEEVMRHDLGVQRAVAGWSRLFARLSDQTLPKPLPHDLRLRLLGDAEGWSDAAQAARRGWVTELLAPAAWGVTAALLVFALMQYFE